MEDGKIQDGGENRECRTNPESSKRKINNLPQAGIETKAFSKGNEGY
tara:strand:- start:124 stop:264 length:141 start_codon:yes stop_codon:yes gene_type:complete